MKKWVQRLLVGVALGSFLFNLTMLAFLVIASEEVLQIVFAQYAENFLASLFIGIVFSIMSFVYDKDGWSMPIQILVHMGSGMLAYVCVAFFMGWISTQLHYAALSVGIALGIAGLIWLGFYLYNRAQCRRFNEVLQQKNNV